jgi:hypothetical protein
MKTRRTFPRIAAVEPLTNKRLRVKFDNDVTKIYDCSPLLANEAFRPLRDDGLFRAVRSDPHGYAVIWNDYIDLAESELWLRGESVAE